MAIRICETCKKKGNRCCPNANGTCESYDPRAITWFEKFKLMDIEEFTEWLDEHGRFDNSPWMKWFDKLYCSNCESIMCRYEDSNIEFPCAWCELEHKCKFFPELKESPDNKDMIKMWLQAEVE